MKYLHTAILGIAFLSVLAQPTDYSSLSLSRLLDSAQARQEVSQYNEVRGFLKEAASRLDSNSSKTLWYSYYKTSGVNWFETRNIPEAQKAFEKALTIAYKLNDSLKIGLVHSEMANTYGIQGEYQKALDSYSKALDYYPSRDKNYNASLLNMAMAYQGLNEYDKALSALSEGKAFFKKNNDYRNQAIIENNIGELYRSKIMDLDKAEEHYHRAIKANQRIDNKAGLAQNYHNISALMLSREEPDSAMVYALLSKKLKESLGDEGGMASTNFNLASIYYQKGDYRQAIAHFEKSLEQSKRYQLMQGIYYNSLKLGELYRDQSRYRESEELLLDALELAEQSGQLQMITEANKTLYSLYKKQGNYAKALTYHEKAWELNDSLTNLKSDQHLDELRTQYEADIAETENLVLKEKEKAQTLELISQRNLLYLSVASIVLLALAGVWLFNSLRQRNLAFANEKGSKEELKRQYQKTKESEEKLARANDLKNRILSVLGHDLRSPLNSISGLLSTMSYSAVTPEELQEMLGYLKKETDTSLNVLQEILAWARLQMDERDVMIQRIDPSELLKEVMDMHDQNARTKGMDIAIKTDEGIELWADRNQMRSVWGNLVSNAIKFSPQGGKIDITIQEDESHVKFSLCDQGKGIPPQVLNNLGKRTKINSEKGTVGERGTGIGLRIVRDFVEAHQGSLKFQNIDGGGTRAVVLIPKHLQRHLKTG